MGNEMTNLDLMREDWLRNLATSKDPEKVLLRYHILMVRVYDTLERLSAEEEADRIITLLESIEECDSQIREYLYEEASATLGCFDDATGKVTFSHLPENVRFIPSKTGFSVSNLPVWTMGHGAKKKYHPMYHKNRPYVRKRQLWYSLFEKFRSEYLHDITSWEESLIPEKPPEYARMLVVFRSRFEYEVQDLDHYLSSLESVVNGMVSNKLVRSDRASHFSYAVNWESQNEDIPCVDLHVRWSDVPFPMWTGFVTKE